MKAPINVTVTGAAGNIGYALLFRLASGSCYGKDQPIKLRLLEITPALPALEGVVMELVDGAFPLLHGVDISDDANVAFAGANQAYLVGGKPRGPGMDRSDLIKANGPIFTGQGKAINDHAADDIRVIVVGNPCNTNCLIAMHAAPDVPKERFTAMTRLDENRAKGQLAQKLGITPGAVRRMGIWGNHSNTMVPDFQNATANGKPVADQIDRTWLESTFVDTVALRGGAIIKARGQSSAASAASAAHDHMASWWHGTDAGDFVSMAVASQGHYGVPEGLIFSFPVTIQGGKWSVVEGLAHDAWWQTKLDATVAELQTERAAVADLLR